MTCRRCRQEMVVKTIYIVERTWLGVLERKLQRSFLVCPKNHASPPGQCTPDQKIPLEKSHV